MNTFYLLLAAVFAVMIAAPATAADTAQTGRVMVAKNPCAANPCATKNPCSAKNPCSPMAAPSDNPRLRKNGIATFKEAAARGERLWKDPKLGKSGLSCETCHAGGAQLNLEKMSRFPKYVAMPNDVVTLDQMINYCMMNPLAAEPLAWDSVEMTSLAAYYKALAKKHHKNMGKGHRGKNPCGMKNPCAAKNPCGGK